MNGYAVNQDLVINGIDGTASFLLSRTSPDEDEVFNKANLRALFDLKGFDRLSFKNVSHVTFPEGSHPKILFLNPLTKERMVVSSQEEATSIFLSLYKDSKPSLGKISDRLKNLTWQECDQKGFTFMTQSHIYKDDKNPGIVLGQSSDFVSLNPETFEFEKIENKIVPRFGTPNGEFDLVAGVTEEVKVFERKFVSKEIFVKGRKAPIKKKVECLVEKTNLRFKQWFICSQGFFRLWQSIYRPEKSDLPQGKVMNHKSEKPNDVHQFATNSLCRKAWLRHIKRLDTCLLCSCPDFSR